MADGAVVTFLLESLSYQIKEYYSLVAGAKNELSQLNDQLELLRGFLEQAAKKQEKEEQFRKLEKIIREVVYDAEDVIDTCLTEAAVARLKNPLNRVIFNLKRANLAKMVKSLREDKVTPLFDRAKVEFGTMELGNGTRTGGEKPGTTKEEVDLPRPEQSVIGFERDQEIIISCLKEEGRTNTLDVIRITGIPGQGKTTLARKIFDNTGVRSQFEFNIWVDVSLDFNMRDVLLSICEQMTSDESNIRDLSSMKFEKLALTVRARLQMAKFFIVFDDVWTDEVWNKILKILPDKNWKSKVLITSRQTSVGANAAREPHRLEGLNNEDSWELLKLEVFRGPECPEDLVKIGKYIAAQCDGLPMSIVVVGGILRKKSEKKQNTTTADVRNAWNEVSKDVSIAYKDKNISKIVALSYNILPYEMKICLLYLGMFPEDYEIPVWTLIHLWIAEGFIQCRKKQTMEEAAYEILDDLIDRNLVTVAKRNSQGKIKTCRVPDVIRDFCISEAEQANLLQEIKRSKEEDFYPPASDIDKCRRLCIHSNLQNFLSKIMSTKVKSRRVRSFLSFSQPVPLGEEYISTIPHTFNLLRVLDSKSMVFPEFPSRISKLIHLRYITLSFNFEFNVLPEPLSELWNLQTLIIDTKSRMLKIEANIWKMIQLRHLKTKAEIILAVESGKGGEGGEKLQTLTRLSPKHCKRNMFKQTRKLKKLGIRGSLAHDFNATSLAELEELENLKLVNDLATGLPSESPLPNLPPHNCFPKNIKKLTLSGTYLDWADMHVLGMIKCLEELKLKDHAFTGKFWEPRTGSDFPSLQFFLIAETDLMFWAVVNGQFPGLKWLVLNVCVNLTEIPLSLLTSLEILDIENVGKSAVQCAEKMKSQKDELKLFVK